MTELTIGKPGRVSGSAVVSQSAHAISISRAVSINGPVGVYGSVVAVNENITTTATDATVTLRASAYIHVTTSKQIRTTGGDIVLWSDSDANNGAGLRKASERLQLLCTTASTCTTTNTGGGDIVIGGGNADPANTSRPVGPAAGSGTTYNTHRNL